jgi:ketosteroid isomerase-like protein
VSKPTFTSPIEAEAAFYGALTRRDIAAMMTVWDTAEDIVCIHPLGTVLSGSAAVRASWEGIFRSDNEMKFVVEERHRSQSDTLAIHIVREHIRSGGKQHPPVAATNIYRLTEHGWRMILHHASPAPEPEAGDTGAQTLH